MRKEWDEQCGGKKIDLHLFETADLQNRTSINLVSKEAYLKGFDFFFHVSDDLELVGNNWTSHLIDVMITRNDLFGAAEFFAEKKTGRRYAIVGRKHLEIFGYFFPFSLSNFWSDEWLANIYNSGLGNFERKKISESIDANSTNLDERKFKFEIERARILHSKQMCREFPNSFFCGEQKEEKKGKKIVRGMGREKYLKMESEARTEQFERMRRFGGKIKK